MVSESKSLNAFSTVIFYKHSGIYRWNSKTMQYNVTNFLIYDTCILKI